MKTNLFSKIACLGFISLLISSCIDNEVELSAFGDAYILVEVNGQDTVKGLGLHAYSYSEFKSVVVNPTGNPSQIYTLTPYLDFKQDYLYTTPLSQFSKTLPAKGEYVFNATFTDGQTLAVSDVLTSDFIAPPKIVRCTYFKQSATVEVEWEKVKLADAYNVKLIDQTGKILFVSPAYSNSTTVFSFGSGTQGWQSSTSVPAEGQVVKVEVAAYLMEPTTVQDELQCISKSRVDITWGK
jgi:hypothetical protein